MKFRAGLAGDRHISALSIIRVVSQPMLHVQSCVRTFENNGAHAGKYEDIRGPWKFRMYT